MPHDQSMDGPQATTHENTKKPCRACTDFRGWARQQAEKYMPKENKAKEQSPAEPIISPQEKPNVVITPNIMPTPPIVSSECPPDKAKIGRHSWTLLHTMAAYYPDQPTTKQQQDMSQFMSILSRFYPCDDCSTHLRASLERRPPAVQSQQSLSQWVCQLHNEVNRYLGKEEFDCSRTNERWRDGPEDGSCD